jgi:predicted nucleotidyltransferase
MDVGQPLLDVIPGVRGAVLGALARLTEPRTGRQIARAAGQAQSSTARVLDDLVAAGLVLQTTGGRDNFYELNPEHLAAPAIRALATLRGALLDRLRDAVRQHPDVIAAWLFGSAARGDGDRNSDIDLLIVHNASDELGATAGALSTLAQDWTGNPVQVVEHTVATFSALIADHNPLVDAIRRDGIALTEASDPYLAQLQ